MKRTILAAALFCSDSTRGGGRAFAAEGHADPPSPLALLNEQRRIRQPQVQMADPQRRYEAAAAAVRELQAQMQADCASAAKEGGTNLARYPCDPDKLTFARRPDPPGSDPPKDAPRPQ